eukprot:6199363-Pleurochrysis_carterae.AAC.3
MSLVAVTQQSHRAYRTVRSLPLCAQDSYLELRSARELSGPTTLDANCVSAHFHRDVASPAACFSWKPWSCCRACRASVAGQTSAPPMPVRRPPAAMGSTPSIDARIRRSQRETLLCISHA